MILSFNTHFFDCVVDLFFEFLKNLIHNSNVERDKWSFNKLGRSSSSNSDMMTFHTLSSSPFLSLLLYRPDEVRGGGFCQNIVVPVFETKSEIHGNIL